MKPWTFGDTDTNDYTKCKFCIIEGIKSAYGNKANSLDLL